MPEFIDRVIPQMNQVAADEAPVARIPWIGFVLSSRYRAIISEIQELKKTGQLLIPQNAPIGYLPGDNINIIYNDASINYFNVDGKKIGNRIMLTVANGVSYNVQSVTPWRNDWFGGTRPKSQSWTVEISATINCQTNKWEPEVTNVSLTIETFSRLYQNMFEASVSSMDQYSYCDMVRDLSYPVDQEVARTYYVLSGQNLLSNRTTLPQFHKTW